MKNIKSFCNTVLMLTLIGASGSVAAQSQYVVDSCDDYPDEDCACYNDAYSGGYYCVIYPSDYYTSYNYYYDYPYDDYYPYTYFSLPFFYPSFFHHHDHRDGHQRTRGGTTWTHQWNRAPTNATFHQSSVISGSHGSFGGHRIGGGGGGHRGGGGGGGHGGGGHHH